MTTDLTPGEATPEGTELIQTRRLPLAEAVRMASRGEIKDALGVLGLLPVQEVQTQEKSDATSHNIS